MKNYCQHISGRTATCNFLFLKFLQQMYIYFSACSYVGVMQRGEYNAKKWIAFYFSYNFWKIVFKQSFVRKIFLRLLWNDVEFVSFSYDYSIFNKMSNKRVILIFKIIDTFFLLLPHSSVCTSVCTCRMN